MSYRLDEHYDAPTCSKCNDTGRVGSAYHGYESCECMDEYDDVHFCSKCGREIDRPTGCCQTPDYVCGWVHPEYEPTEAELTNYYDTSRVGARERVEMGRAR